MNYASFAVTMYQTYTHWEISDKILASYWPPTGKYPWSAVHVIPLFLIADEQMAKKLVKYSDTVLLLVGQQLEVSCDILP
jgi:hypothetical protein